MTNLDDRQILERFDRRMADLEAEIPSPPPWRGPVVRADGPRLGFGSLFSATKIVLAGAIVALFGGFLLAGVLTTQPRDDSVPAAGSGSVEPPAWQEAGSLEWERVEIPEELDDATGSYLGWTGTYLIASTPSRRTLASRDGRTWSGISVDGELIDSFGASLVVADGDRLSTVRVADDRGAAADRLIALDGLALPDRVSRAGFSPLRVTETAYGPAGLVLVGGDADGQTSTVWHTADGLSWDQVYESAGETWEGVTATADGFVARTDRTGDSPGDFAVLYSTDGHEWGRVNEQPSNRYEPIGYAAFGTVLLEPLAQSDGYGAPVVATPDGLEPLTVPAEVEAWWTSAEPGSSWGAGGLGLVGLGLTDRMVALSTDGAMWHLGTLPDIVPRLLPGYNRIGRPLLHVAEDMVFLETGVCLEPDGTEVDCPEVEGLMGDKRAWFRGTPTTSATDQETATLVPSDFPLRITGYRVGQPPAMSHRAGGHADTGPVTITGLALEGEGLVDPRALGSVTEVWTWYHDVASNGIGVGRGATRVENDGGAWVGIAQRYSLGVGVEVGTAVWELVGEGGYLGLTMFLWGEFGETSDIELTGIIVSGDSVPDFPPPPPEAVAATE